MKIVNYSNEYHKSKHLVFSCQYHVIFCPKYRRSVLTGDIKKRLKEVFSDVAEEYDFSILEIEVLPDHVHLIVDTNPRFGVMQCITKLKRTSSRLLRKEFPSLKSRLPSLWTRSAFISSVGSVSLKVVKQYIRDQKGK